jgi:NAD(P)H-dependent FMN reductase
VVENVRHPTEIDHRPRDLLVVWHPVPPSIHALRDAVLAGVADAGDPLPVRSLPAPDAGVADVEAAAGAILVTTENFGMVSGLMKDFLERIYPWFEEVPNRRPGLPYLLISKGASDGTGAVRDVTRILTGLRWKEVLPPIVIAGSLADRHVQHVREQAATLAAGLEAGIF